MAETSQAVKMLRRLAAKTLPDVIHRELHEWKRHGWKPSAILMTEDLLRLLMATAAESGEPNRLFNLPIKTIVGEVHWELVTNRPWERG